MIITSGHCVTNFSTFENNHAVYADCFEQGFQYEGDYQDYFCNVVNNSQETSGLGCIRINSELTVENCTILGKYGEGKVFSVDRYGELIIKNCIIDEYSFEGSNPVAVAYITGNKLNSLSHLSTNICIINEGNQTLFKNRSKLQNVEIAMLFLFLLFSPK